MKKLLTGTAMVALAAPALVVGMAVSSDATGCVTMIDSYRTSGSTYAVVKNNCGRTVSAQVVVDNFPDTSCYSIAAYGKRTYRTGGSWAPMPDYAREC